MMKHLRYIPIVAVLPIVLVGCRNTSENYAQSDIFHNEPTESTMIVDLPNGEATTIIVIEMPTSIPYEILPFGSGWIGTGFVTLEQLSDIPANTPYADIAKKIGAPFHCRQFVTDDNRVLAIYAPSKDMCPYSGKELYERALPLNYDGEIPDGMMYGILVEDGTFFVHYCDIMPDGVDAANLDARDAEIVFKDGTPASVEDLKIETAALIKYDYSLDSYPQTFHCTKIVILK